VGLELSELVPVGGGVKPGGVKENSKGLFCVVGTKLEEVDEGLLESDEAEVVLVGVVEVVLGVVLWIGGGGAARVVVVLVV
jgi:hypothetical protein